MPWGRAFFDGAICWSSKTSWFVTGLPVLRDLVSVGRETANLAVLDGTDVLYMAQFESMERLRMSEAVGTRQPAHSTALGKALLASLPEEQFDHLYSKSDVLKSPTASTITDARHLKEHLQKVRNEGTGLRLRRKRCWSRLPGHGGTKFHRQSDRCHERLDADSAVSRREVDPLKRTSARSRKPAVD
jgi:hypothetical protein